MGSKGTAEYWARQRERERQRRAKAQRASRQAKPPTPADAPRPGSERRAAATECAWCGKPIVPRNRGPIPKWCSTTCRQGAWEQTRAAGSGCSAVRIVERHVEVAVSLVPTRRDWPQLLHELTRQLDDGRVYDRDLLPLATALDAVLNAYRRRPLVRDRSRGSGFGHLQ